jgi:hypothetical protein
MANGIVTGGLYSVNGSFTLAGSAVGRGTFVVPDYSADTAATPTENGLADVWFVMNAVTTPKELGQDDADFTVAVGEKLELAKLQLGATFITDQFASTYASYDVGDAVMVSNAGVLMDDSSGNFVAKIKEKLANWNGAPALRCIVTKV